MSGIQAINCTSFLGMLVKVYLMSGTTNTLMTSSSINIYGCGGYGLTGFVSGFWYIGDGYNHAKLVL